MTVPAADWVAEVTAARDRGYRFFDWLSAVDELEGGIRVAVHLWSVQAREGVLLTTVVDGVCPSLVGVFRGAGWHERETAEMFGIAFEGNPDQRPLLLPDGFQGHPLRKDFALASRAVKAWPGAKEPGESDADLAAAASSTVGQPAVTAPESRPTGAPSAAVGGQPTPTGADAVRKPRRGNVPPGVPDGWPAGLPTETARPGASPRAASPDQRPGVAPTPADRTSGG